MQESDHEDSGLFSEYCLELNSKKGKQSTGGYREGIKNMKEKIIMQL